MGSESSSEGSPGSPIVVGIDFSSCARSALWQAVRMAQWREGTALHVVHVIESLVASELAKALPGSDEEVVQQIVEHAEKELDSWISEMPIDVQRHVVIGTPIGEIVQLVRAVGAGLLVVGAWGVAGPGRGAGTLATKCVRKVPAPVLLVNEAHTDRFARVVAGVDFSDLCRVAVEQAIEVAVQDEAHLDLLHVFRGPWHKLHYRAPTPEALPDFRRQYEAALRSHLEQFLDEFADATHEVVEGQIGCCLLDRTDSGRGIAEFARDKAVDLVVLGTRGHTNLRYVFLGTTAERVLREAPCSVLTIKPSEFVLPGE